MEVFFYYIVAATHLSIQEVESLDYYDASLLLYNSLKIQQTEIREQYEQLRLQTYYLSRPHMKKKIPIKSFMKFPWDKAHKKDINVVVPSEDRIKQLSTLFKKDSNVN